MPHADPQQRQAYNRAYKRQNRWRYRRRQKSWDAAKHANERAARYGVPGVIDPDDVERVLDVGACGHCGVPLPYELLELDHIVPLSRGGANDTFNLIASCDPCNSQKSAKPDPKAWATEHERCVECGMTERRHVGRGMCALCHSRMIERSRNRSSSGPSAKRQRSSDGPPATQGRASAGSTRDG